MAIGDITLVNMGVYKVNQTSISGAALQSLSVINLGAADASGGEIFLIPVGGGQGIQVIKKSVSGW